MRTIGLQTDDGRHIAREVRIADTFFSRSIGLLRAGALHEQQGLLLMRCGSVHTLGMRFPIDVVFLDSRMRILSLSPNVPPHRLRIAPAGTTRALELAAGRIAAIGLRVGRYILVEHGMHTTSAEVITRKFHPRTHVPPMCTRSPVQFSLRRPLHRPAAVHSDLGCNRSECDRTTPVRLVVRAPHD